jgi:transcriptional regulator
MYIPRHNRVEDVSLLYQLMEHFSFATLVSIDAGVPVATHLPFMIEPPQDGGQGKLICHLARANKQWKTFALDQEVLVIFQGHHAYISPNWYDPPVPQVPTWNYMVVHAYGVPHIIDSERQITDMLRRLVEKHESGFEKPWQMDLPADYLHSQIQAIVALEIPITRLEGKFKLSQNRNAADYARVVEGLSSSSDPVERALGEIMRESIAG